MMCSCCSSCIPWGFVAAAEYAASVVVIYEVTTELSSQQHRLGWLCAAAATLALSMRCVCEVWRFHDAASRPSVPLVGRAGVAARPQRPAPHDGYLPRPAALPTSAEVEEARWATPTAARSSPKAYTQLKEVNWPLSPVSPVSFAPASAQAHEALLHVEDGACAKWCALCNAWVRLPAAHCSACGRCVVLRDGHSGALGVCVGADNRERYCALVAKALVLQLVHLGAACAFFAGASEAAPLRGAAAAPALEWARPALRPAELLGPCAPALALGAFAGGGALALWLCLLRQLAFACLVEADGDTVARHQYDVRRRADCRQRLLAGAGAARWAAQRAEVLRVRPGARGSERQGLLHS